MTSSAGEAVLAPSELGAGSDFFTLGRPASPKGWQVATARVWQLGTAIGHAGCREEGSTWFVTSWLSRAGATLPLKSFSTTSFPCCAGCFGLAGALQSSAEHHVSDIHED